MTDDDESIFDKIVEEMEDEAASNHGADANLTQATNIPHIDVPWLNQNSVQVLHDYIHYLAKADDIKGCIQRLRSLADFLNDEADKLQANGPLNFHRSHDLH